MSNFFHIRCETDKILILQMINGFTMNMKKGDDIWFYSISYLNLLLK